MPIYQWEAEFSQLLDIYRELKPARVLEIGTYHGGTLYHWLQNATEGTTVVSVDNYAVGVDNRSLYQDWIPNGVSLITIKGASEEPQTVEAIRKAIRGKYDWVFIDGGHFYEEVKADWENYRPMVKKGGVVVFHDILPPSEVWPDIEVNRLWKEIKAEGYETQEIIHDRRAAWGGIGLVFL